jgi:hypothetical protein
VRAFKNAYSKKLKLPQKLKKGSAKEKSYLVSFDRLKTKPSRALPGKVKISVKE